MMPYNISTPAKIALLFIYIVADISFSRITAQPSSNPETQWLDRRRTGEVFINFYSSLWGAHDDMLYAMSAPLDPMAGAGSGGFHFAKALSRPPHVSAGWKFNVSPHSGIAIGFGRLDGFTLRSPDGNGTVKSILNALALDYVYSFGHNRHDLRAGISRAVHRIKPTSKFSSLATFHDRKKYFTLNFGYGFRIVETGKFYLMLQTQITLLPQDTLKPFTLHEVSHPNPYAPFFEAFDIDIPEYTTPVNAEFPGAGFRLTTVNIGITMGFTSGQKINSRPHN
jgi:hypothetical protein